MHKKLPQSTVKRVLPSNKSYESKTSCNRTIATVLWVPLIYPHVCVRMTRTHKRKKMEKRKKRKKTKEKTEKKQGKSREKWQKGKKTEKSRQETDRDGSTPLCEIRMNGGESKQRVTTFEWRPRWRSAMTCGPLCSDIALTVKQLSRTVRMSLFLSLSAHTLESQAVHNAPPAKILGKEFAQSIFM